MIRFRRLRRVGGSAVAVVVAASAGGAVAASRGARAEHRSVSRGCYPKGSTTIAQDKAGRFYSSRHGFRSGPWYVCLFKQGTPRELRYAIPLASSAKVSGRYVAWFDRVRGPGGQVAVYDMATGHRNFDERTGRYGSLVLRANGSIAWIASKLGPPANPPTWEVSRHDSTGTAIVASGPQIDPHSLAADGQWLYWTDVGSPRSAPFH